MSGLCQNKARSFLKEHWAWVIVGAYLLAAFIYICCRGESIYVTVHDNMEDLMPRTYILKQTGTLFAHNVDIPILGGVDRDFFPSELKLYTWLFQIFPPFIAYLATMLLAVLLPTVTWPVMTRQMPTVFRLENKTDENYMVLCGFLYGLLPKEPLYTIAFATLPLLLALLCSIYKRPTWWKYLLLFVFPVVSDFTYFGIFVCGYMVLYIAWHTVAKRQVPVPLLVALPVLAAGYVITDYRLFSLMLVSRIPTLRGETVYENMSLGQAVYEGIKAFATGHYHSGTLHFYFIFWACGAYFVWNNWRRIREKQYRAMITDPFNLLMIWAAGNAMLHGFQNFAPLRDLVAALLPPLKGWQYARALWFNPLLWVWMFSLVVLHVLHAERERPRQKQRKILLRGSSLLMLGGFAAIFIFPWTYSDIALNERNIVVEILDLDTKGITRSATWEEFYAEDLFEQIKTDIAYDGEWSIAFGFHPAVLYWNGIATLDGYHPFYPLAYKEKFLQLVKPLLEESEHYRDYIGGWGARAYAYSPDIEIVTDHGIKNGPADLPIDPEVFRDMGGTYVFSAVEIRNADELGLDCIGHWKNENSLYAITVYKTKD